MFREYVPFIRRFVMFITILYFNFKFFQYKNVLWDEIYVENFLHNLNLYKELNKQKLIFRILWIFSLQIYIKVSFLIFLGFKI